MPNSTSELSSTLPNSVTAPTDPIPLVVDMDGTLIRSDMTVASLFWFAAHRPQDLVQVPLWLRQGRNIMKARLAEADLPPVENLPLNPPCVDLLREARAAGIKTVLASASDARIVEAVAKETGLFDEWYGSDPTTNLKGKNKAAFLTEKFGAKGFDYVGDSTADLSVWRAARRAITIDATPRLRAKAEAANSEIEHLSPSSGALSALIRPILKAMRLHQWAKNLLIFVPLFAGHFLSPQTIFASVLAFVAFGILASSTYLINDLLDLDADRAHPRKRKRPFASGEAPLLHGLVAIPLLAGSAVLISLVALPSAFLAILLLYCIATLTYSLWLKTKVFVDIFVLAGLYTLRILAGTAAISAGISPWLLAFSMFFFLSLAVVKRLVELQGIIASNGQRTLKRDYRADDLGLIQAFGAASGYLSVLVLALYFNSPEAMALYKSPDLLWAICPLLLFWISRILILSNRGELHDDPIVFTARDRTSYLVGLAVAAVIAVGYFY